MNLLSRIFLVDREATERFRTYFGRKNDGEEKKLLNMAKTQRKMD
jgi:hypothetical protein